MALLGTEKLYVEGIAANGQLSGGTFHTTTQAIANLANADGGVGLAFGGIATGTFSQASNTTLASVTGLSASVVAGATYAFEAYLATTNSATGGIKLSLNGGTATMTSFLADTMSYSTTTLEAETNVSAISSSLIDTATASTLVLVNGTMVVNAAGTIQLQAAQHASNGTATTITNGSSLVLTRLA